MWFPTSACPSLDCVARVGVGSLPAILCRRTTCKLRASCKRLSREDFTRSCKYKMHRPQLDTVLQQVLCWSVSEGFLNQSFFVKFCAFPCRRCSVLCELTGHRTDLHYSGTSGSSHRTSKLVYGAWSSFWAWSVPLSSERRHRLLSNLVATSYKRYYNLQKSFSLILNNSH